jgi:SAM-dependent methyltransferase
MLALQRARMSAFPVGEYAGQESFMRASEIRQLAGRAGIATGVPVLDVCCGTGGPGRLITAAFGCRYLGIDCSADALRIAARLAANLPCRFAVARVPPLPPVRAEVVLLLETMLAFPDKAELVREVARVLRPGGRFACTVEEGRPLSGPEQRAMPDADTVWPIELARLTALLREAGLEVTWQQEHTSAHRATAAALLCAFRADSARIADRLGPVVTAELIAAHERWCEWLGTGRVRKFALVAQKAAART